MKVDQEFLKKHQFWLLLGLAVFLWLISLGVVFISARAKAAKETADYTKSQKENTSPADPKNETFNTPWNERKDIYSKRKNEVWEEAWKTQTNIMTWPGTMITEQRVDLK